MRAPGWGSALVRKMTGLLGGVVSVRSEPGRGSRFTIELPWKRLEHEQSPDQTAMAPAANANSTALMRVEPLDSHQLISAALAELGIQSMVYPCFLEVLPRIRSLQPALIVIEVLPGDPVPTELLRLLASDPDPVLRGIHVLLISGDIEASGFGSDAKAFSGCRHRSPGRPCYPPLVASSQQLRASTWP